MNQYTIKYKSGMTEYATADFYIWGFRTVQFRKYPKLFEKKLSDSITIKLPWSPKLVKEVTVTEIQSITKA